MDEFSRQSPTTSAVFSDVEGDCDTDGNDIETAFYDGQVFSLWICDVHKLTPCSAKNLYNFRGMVVQSVRIFGTVVSTLPFKGSNACLYEVDDGTATITCFYNVDWQFDSITNRVINKVIPGIQQIRSKKKPVEGAEEQFRSTEEQNCISWLVRQIKMKEGQIKCQLKEGDRVCLTGRIKYFNGKREIKVCSLHRIDSVNEETGHILEFLLLYKGVYQKMLKK